MTGEFIGRENELQYLENLWQSEGLVTCCVWGRRRIGKSRLLDEFSKNKRTLYMQAVGKSYYENLSSLSMDVSKFCGHEVEVKDLSHLMDVIEGLCAQEHTLVIIDEFPFLTESAPQAASVVQKSLDRGFRGVNCMFVICGSSISVMRKETESYDRPLYGRFTNSLHVKQIKSEESVKFLPGMNSYDALKWYVTVGGIPQYLLTGNKKTYESNVSDLFFKHQSPWKDDAPQTILQEFGGNLNYTGAVRCIADGYVRQAEIADKLMIDRAACKRILDDLEFVDIIERKHPMGNSPKKPVYRIKDPFIAFHYTVRERNSRLIDTSDSPGKAYRLLSDRIDSHLGRMFETVCTDWLKEHLTVTEIGSWWGRDSEGEDVDIDIVAKAVDDKDSVHTLACECKFGKNPIGFTPLNTLMRRCEDAKIGDNVKFVLFSAGGFSDELREYSEENGIVLIDCEMLMGMKEIPKIV